MDFKLTSDQQELQKVARDFANKELVSRPYVPKTENTVKKPEGEAPAGKVWSAEHGHWHDK